MTISEYQKEAHKFADYPSPIAKDGDNDVVVNYAYPAMGLAEEAGEVLGKFAKAIRDEHSEISPERKLAIVGELGDCCWFIAELATLLDVDLTDVMEGNINKLKSRRERGKIHGSGDNR